LAGRRVARAAIRLLIFNSQDQSRSGHIWKFDDTKGSEKIEIVDKDGKRRVVIDTANQKIQITCDSGDVEVSAPQGTAKVQAQSVQIQASQDMSIEAKGTLTIKGQTVNIN
jgi:hypothetical protein